MPSTTFLLGPKIQIIIDWVGIINNPSRYVSVQDQDNNPKHINIEMVNNKSQINSMKQT